MPGIFVEAIPADVHMNSGNYGFVDGHPETVSINPIHAYGAATGGERPWADPGYLWSQTSR